MPSSPLEIYRDWEQNPPASVVHVMAIFRGNGADANVLTLTDKPYIDKGVSGTRYHHSRPAPIQCIYSDIRTKESQDSTAYNDIKLTNGEGLLDGLLDDEEIVGKEFVMYRGDQRWSILETELPYRFEQIFIGQIDAVEYPGDGRDITLKISPKLFDLDTSVAGPDSPLLVGGARSIPMTLVDDATHQYRFNTTFPLNQTAAVVVIKDNGVILVNPTDYTLTNEGGIFKGLVTLATAPSGKLTAFIRTGLRGKGEGSASNFMLHFVTPDYEDILIDSSATNPSNVEKSDFILAEDINKLYMRQKGFFGHVVDQRSYTGTDLLSSTDDSKTLDLRTVFGGASADFVCIDISPDGRYLFSLDTSGVFKRSTLSTAGDITTAGASDQSIDLYTLNSSAVYHVRIKGDRLYYSTTTRRIISVDLAGDFDISSGTIGETLSFNGYGINWRSTAHFDISDDLRSIIFLSDPDLDSGRQKIHQLHLTTADDLSEWYYEDRLIDVGFLNDFNSISVGTDDTLFRFFDSDAKIILSSDWSTSGGDYHFIFEITDKLLPREFFGFNPDLLTTETILYPSVYHDSDVKAGQVLSEIISTASDSFFIDRLGKIASVVIRAPEDQTETQFSISDAEILGESGDRVRVLKQQQKPKNFILKYSPNFAVQSQSEIAGSVSEDLKQIYAREWESRTSSISGAPSNSPTIIKEIYFYQYDSPNKPLSYYPESVVNRMRSVHEEVRTTFEVKARLAATPHFNNNLISLGSFVEMDFSGAFFARGSYAQLHGREINWSKNYQTLELFL